MKKSQKYIVIIGDGNHNPRSKAFNVSNNKFENVPDNLHDPDFHFDNEEDAHKKMIELNILLYSIEDAYWPEEINAK